MSEEQTLDEFAGDTGATSEQTGQPESRFWNQIPNGWKLVDGTDVYEVNPNPKSDEEPNTYIEMDALDTELPWPRYFGERNASEYSGKTFSAGDTLFARITPCTENGKAALVPEMDTRVGIGSTEYAVLSPRRERILPWYLFYLAKSHPVHDYAVSRMRGSTGRQRVPFSVFRQELDIALPPLEEQRKIASVLYTVDQAIRKTEEITEQVQGIKQGLVNEVVLRGIECDSYQSIRVGPHEFEIPSHWETVSITESCENLDSVRIPVSQSDREDMQVIFRIMVLQDASTMWMIISSTNRSFSWLKMGRIYDPEPNELPSKSQGKVGSTTMLMFSVPEKGSKSII